ncbi:calcium:proton antiporter [Jatrophihabitans sp. YIM 134969]
MTTTTSGRRPDNRSTVLSRVPSWTTLGPVIAIVALVLTWGRELPGVWVGVVAVLLGVAVLAAVHHAEVVAHKVGEPFGSLVLAVAVTVIEVALIVTLMISGGKGAETLARDTVFSAVIITCAGIVGISLLVATLRNTHEVRFNADGPRSTLATVTTLTVLCLVLPTLTTSVDSPEFSGAQLAFAAVVSAALYALFVFTQTVRHRDYFLPVDHKGRVVSAETMAEEDDEHADPPSNRTTWVSVGLLAVSLVGVVGLAKIESPSIEKGVAAVGFPPSVVGIVIALLVLLPETLAAVRAARRGRLQTSLNLALGSAMASIGMTIPAIAVASIFLDGPVLLGLGSTQIAILALTIVVSALTIIPGRASLMQAGTHLLVVASFLFFAISP